MRPIDGDALKRRAQKVSTEAWKMKIKAEVETILNQFIDWINEAPTIQSEPHWIPVTERPPEVGADILFCDIDGDVYAGHRTRHSDFYPDFSGDKIKNVVAWMPKPEPYKGVTE